MEKQGSCERCPDFIAINDGTISGDNRFCDLSFKCKQIGYRSVAVSVGCSDGMDAYDLLCTGFKMEKGENSVEVI